MKSSFYKAEEIYKKMNDNPDTYISECEENYALQVKNAVSEVCKKEGHRLIMLAGPSSSGKTTTAGLIKKEAGKNGRNAIVISLDDFYLDQQTKLYFEDGTPDFETVKALDIEYITKCLSQLIKTGKSMLPKFDFKTKKREADLYPTEIGKDEIVIVEGLHAINPIITDNLAKDNLTKMYVSVSSRISKEGKILFTKRDLRFIRRLIRDYHFRASDVEYTFKLWKGVRMGEDRYLFPFGNLADVRIDSIHPYEPCLFKDEAQKLLSHIGKDSEFYETASGYIEKLSFFESINKNMIPADSLLHEFIG